MAQTDIQELLKKPTVDLTDKVITVKTDRDGYTRTHEGQYNYIVKDEGGKLFVYPIQTDGEGTFHVMKKSPIIYTDGDNIHFVVNTVTDPYTEAFIRTENIKGLDKGKQLLQAFLAFVENRFQLGIYNIFVADYREKYFHTDDAVPATKDLDRYAHEELIVDFPNGNRDTSVKAVDLSDKEANPTPPSLPGGEEM